MSAARNLADLINQGGNIKPGTTAFFAMDSAPTGFLKANGAAVSRTTYADLFSAIGVTYGSGDGSTTFNLPDLRGEFLRGWDDGRGADAGRSFGSFQGDVVGPHTHDTTGNRIVTVSGGIGLFAGANRFWNGNYPVRATTILSGGGSETRPRNISLLACIKY